MDYQPFYCEENIWKLCDRGVAPGSQVIFISNLLREVVLFQQRAGEPSQGTVVWDYHVILAEPTDDGWQIRDLDTRLDDPCPWPLYRQETFAELRPEYAHWAPSFRVIQAEQYHKHFASDRSHMRDEDGNWVHPPPAWDPIGNGSNLMDFIDQSKPFLGRVVELESVLI